MRQADQGSPHPIRALNTQHTGRRATGFGPSSSEDADQSNPATRREQPPGTQLSTNVRRLPPVGAAATVPPL